MTCRHVHRRHVDVYTCHVAVYVGVMPTCTYHDKRHVGHLDVCVGVLSTCMCLSCRRVHKCHVDVDTGVTLYSDTNLLLTQTLT